MFDEESESSYIDLFMALSNAVELMNPFIGSHHKRVAFIAYSLGDMLSLTKDDFNNLILASLLHDIGAVSIAEWSHLLKFETNKPYRHSEIGYYFFKDTEGFKKIATIIRFHHTRWENGKGKVVNGESVPLASHIIHLADRIEILINRREHVLKQTCRIRDKIKKEDGRTFMPKLIEAFMELSQKESFWLDIINPNKYKVIYNNVEKVWFKPSPDEVENLFKMLSRIIDFKSTYTSTHTRGVVAVSETLARFFCMEDKDVKLMRIAGYLHDIGKLVVPIEILDKPEKLTDEEYMIMKSHAYYTDNIIECIKGFEKVNIWASLHHEKLDGKGYPFHYDKSNIPLGSKIVAVADVFTALAEDRPYRKGMKKDVIIKTLREMIDNSNLDEKVVAVVEENYDEIDSFRKKIQEGAKEEYKNFVRQVSVLESS